MISPTECTVKEISQGRLFFGPSDEFMSEGFIELKAETSFERTNRPVDEELSQVDGEVTIIVDDEKKVLNQGDWLILPAGKPYSLKNKGSDKSLTYIKFAGVMKRILEQ